jgi:RNA polymerase sigma factor (sigma-70 family)
MGTVGASHAMSDDPLSLYLADVAHHRLLTKADEVRLAQQIEAGRVAESRLQSGLPLSAATTGELRRACQLGDDAYQEFVRSNLRLVISIARCYQSSSSVSLVDRIQEGNLGLMHAVDRFEWRKGFKFSTYASWWIRQAISRGIANSARTIRLPAGAREILNRVQRARHELEPRLGRAPTVGELAAELDLSETTVAEVVRYVTEPLSLSEPLHPDSHALLGDSLADASAESPADAAVVASLPGEIERLFVVLTERDRLILRLRFGLDRGEPRTLQEVGELLNLTRERVRQLEARALTKLRSSHHSHDLRASLTN